jgi:8-oxo-dGTP pyrophosphatase MutT (NUDIX family)
LARLRQALRRAVRGPLIAAAVPVRRRDAGGLEFLLVQTSQGGRWTFPKGRIEPGETPSAAAAREAAEEAGVEGEISPEPLGVYRYAPARGGFDEVTAFLLVAERHGLPAEADRTPTWFGFEAARSRLAQGREAGSGEAMERILRAAERAAARDAPDGDGVA